MSIARKILMGAGGAAGDSTFVDDVFSTYLYDGNATARSITTGIDMTKGGLTWIKDRDNAYNHVLQDTVRGAGATTKLSSNLTAGQNDGDNAIQWSGYVSAFNNNGFSLDKTGSGSIDWANVNKSGDDYVSWSFRKQKGFFDIVQYSGNGSGYARTIDHNLGSVPGFIALKKYSAGSSSWLVYHRDLSTNEYLNLNTNLSAQTSANGSVNSVSSTQFTVGVDFNDSATNYIVYLFAGGESTAATARSLAFGGSYDYIQIEQANSDFNFGTGDFTIEGWLKPNSTSGVQTFLNLGSANPAIGIKNNKWWYYNSTVGQSYAGTVLPEVGQWTHYAISRSSGTTRLFINGNPKSSFSDSHNYGTQAISIGGRINGTDPWNGSMSNVRVVKGTAVYTSSFRPSYEPLTNITNTVLLCCNDSSASGSTVTPDTIKVNNQVTASTDSPFDDIGGFKFGEGGDQNLIKCGSYIGQSGANTVNLGWEPQWVMVKNVDSSEPWVMMDSMRGWVNLSGGAISLRANSTGNESAYGPWGPTATGWELDLNQREIDMNEQNYVYIAIRRPDGLVGKPAEAASEVFAMDTGTQGNGEIPCFDSGFTVDYGLVRQPASTHNWFSGSRLTGDRYMYTDLTNSQAQWTAMVWDSNVGFIKNQPSSYQAWMWKRHAGFDVVTYKGNSTAGHAIPHSLNKIPEMIWIKKRDGSPNYAWRVFHKDLNNGVDAYQWMLELNDNAPENGGNIWFNQMPTSTHFTVKTSATTNASGVNYIAMLFASVTGISKVGSYSGSNSSQQISLGFQPRFLIIKNINDARNWQVLDTTRGWGSGNDCRLFMDLNESQICTSDVGAPTSTGFTLTGGNQRWSIAGDTYVYYAHA